jgi:hypothetical protein
MTIFKFHSWQSILIRIGIAFVFGWAGIYMNLYPDKYIHFMPQILRDIIPGYYSLHIFGAYEIILMLWLLSGTFPFYSALIASLTLVSITVVNLADFQVTFRNVAAIFAALSLVAQHVNDRKITLNATKVTITVNPPAQPVTVVNSNS